MRKTKKILTVIILATLLFSLLCISSLAASEDYLDSFYDLLGVDEEYTSNIGVDSLLSELSAVFTKNGGAIAEFFSYALGGVILLAICSLFTSNKYVQSAASFVVMLGIFKVLWAGAMELKEALAQISRVFSGLIPIMSGVTLAGGGVSSAGTEAVTMSLTLNVVLGICVPLLMPLAALILALGVIAPFDSGAAFNKTRAAFMSIIAIATALLLGIISLSSVISTGKDSALMRTAKYSASSLIPIVGGAVSASLSALGAGLSYTKSIIGATSLYALATVALSPLLLLLCYRFILSAAASLTERLSAQGASGGYAAMAAALDGIIAVYTLSVVVILFEIILFMKSGVFVA